MIEFGQLVARLHKRLPKNHLPYAPLAKRLPVALFLSYRAVSGVFFPVKHCESQHKTVIFL